MDVHDKKTRSYNMSCIKNKNTKSEDIVAKYLFSQGFRYRRNVKKLPGTPDIVLRKYNKTNFIYYTFNSRWTKINFDLRVLKTELLKLRALIADNPITNSG